MNDTVGWIIFLLVAWFGLRPLLRGFRSGLRGEGEERADGFWLEIVGEASYQRNLIKVAGPKHEDSAQVFANATVAYEDDNPHDPKAVRVDIDGLTVGYLSREKARRWRSRVKMRQVTCQAVIRGGWDRGGGDHGNYGVWLRPPREFG
jgi:hypothetical protein